MSNASSAVLWPIFHERLDRIPLRAPDWSVYERLNARFADAVASVYQPGDVIWVHDLPSAPVTGVVARSAT